MFTETATKIQKELYPGEVLLWSGQPARGIRFRASDVFIIPFSVLWCGFACFWELSVISFEISFFALFGIPFVLIGNYAVWGRFVMDAWQRSKSYYAVTNQRIVIVSGLFSHNVKSLNLRTLSDVSMDQKLDGSGSLTFGPTNLNNAWAKASWPGLNQGTPTFEMIPDVKEVYRIIHDAQHAVSHNHTL